MTSLKGFYYFYIIKACMQCVEPHESWGGGGVAFIFSIFEQVNTLRFLLCFRFYSSSYNRLLNYFSCRHPSLVTAVLRSGSLWIQPSLLTLCTKVGIHPRWDTSPSQGTMDSHRHTLFHSQGRSGKPRHVSACFGDI